MKKEQLEDLRLYSDPEAHGLRRALAQQYGVNPEMFMSETDRMKCSTLHIMAYATDGRGAAFADITYGFYPVFAQLNDIPVSIIPLRKIFRFAQRTIFHCIKRLSLQTQRTHRPCASLRAGGRNSSQQS